MKICLSSAPPRSIQEHSQNPSSDKMLNICSDTSTASRSRTGKIRSADCISNGMQIALQNHSTPIKNPPSSSQYSETVTDWIINSLWYLTWISSNNLCPWKYILLPSLWSLTREQGRKFHPQPVLWYHTPHFSKVPFTDLPALEVLFLPACPPKSYSQSNPSMTRNSTTFQIWYPWFLLCPSAFILNYSFRYILDRGYNPAFSLHFVGSNSKLCSASVTKRG